MDDDEMDCCHGLDVENELARILQEEIEKEIKENGSFTWKELCDENKETK